MKRNSYKKFAVQQGLRGACHAGIMLAVLLAIQIMGMPVALTGVLVNSIFIYTMLETGIRYSMILAVLSPAGGMIAGHLPPVMYPLMPVIMLGNVSFIALYRLLENRNISVRLLVPALFKALLIGIVGMYIVKILELGDRVTWLVAPVLGLQFFTAIGGILLAEKLFQSVYRQPDKT